MTSSSCEMTRRLGLSLVQTRLLAPEELKEALLSDDEVDISTLNQRAKYFVYGIFEEGKYRVLVTGREAEPFSAAIKEKEVDTSISELRGSCACPGKAVGVVRIVNRPSDVEKMRKGDVLVSISTTPDLVAAMRLASAIVTDSGGLTSHAAIVSRELGVPCVIGTKIATKVLHDGDRVEVDAVNGIVRRL